MLITPYVSPSAVGCVGSILLFLLYCIWFSMYKGVIRMIGWAYIIRKVTGRHATYCGTVPSFPLAWLAVLPDISQLEAKTKPCNIFDFTWL